MVDITDANAIKFINEQIRPIAEAMRNLNVEIDAMTVDWFSGTNTVVGSSASDDIADGRADEGISRLTASDVSLLVTQAITFQTQMNGGGVDGIIAKPCVRPVKVS